MRWSEHVFGALACARRDTFAVMQTHFVGRFGVALGSLVVCFAMGCGAGDEKEAYEKSARASAALGSQQPDPNEGMKCYQDVPMPKGKMEMGLCCFDDPAKGTSHCVTCDAANTCTMGGRKPGALVRGGFVVRDVTFGSGAVLSRQ